MRIAIIGGSGIYDLDMLGNPQDKVIETEYGTIKVKMGSYAGQEVVFLARHEKGHALPPHRINYRANIAALKKLGVERIIGTTSVGGISAKLRPGDFVLLNQFIDMTKNRTYTFYDDAVHVDMTHPYCPEIRETIMKAAGMLKVKVHEKGTYVCTEGPRLETDAEIKMFASLGGDIVGMTNVPECILAREAEICYGGIALVANPAAGFTDKVSYQDIVEMTKSKGDELKNLLMKSVSLIPEERKCSCKDALKGAHFGKLLTK